MLRLTSRMTGASACLVSCPYNHGAWCKRRPGHLGEHRTTSGLTWESK